jgi:hypothetical protein
MLAEQREARHFALSRRRVPPGAREEQQFFVK